MYTILVDLGGLSRVRNNDFRTADLWHQAIEEIRKIGKKTIRLMFDSSR
jgi:hypothetical protein